MIDLNSTKTANGPTWAPEQLVSLQPLFEGKPFIDLLIRFIEPIPVLQLWFEDDFSWDAYLDCSALEAFLLLIQLHMLWTDLTVLPQYQKWHLSANGLNFLLQHSTDKVVRSTARASYDGAGEARIRREFAERMKPGNMS